MHLLVKTKQEAKQGNLPVQVMEDLWEKGCKSVQNCLAQSYKPLKTAVMEKKVAKVK